MKRTLLLIISLVAIACSTDPNSIKGTYSSQDNRLQMDIADDGALSFKSKSSSLPVGSLEFILVGTKDMRLSPWNVSDTLYRGDYNASGLYGNTNIYLELDFDNGARGIQCDLDIKGGLPQYQDTKIVFVKQ